MAVWAVAQESHPVEQHLFPRELLQFILFRLGSRMKTTKKINRSIKSQYLLYPFSSAISIVIPLLFNLVVIV